MIVVNVTVEGIEDLRRVLRNIPKGGGVKAGVIENQKAGNTEVLKYAPIQEFGGMIAVTQKMRNFFMAVFHVHLRDDLHCITIPPRSFMRTTYERNFNKWLDFLVRGVQAGIEERRLWELLGTRMQDDIRETIASNVPPPNSPLTKRYKDLEYPTHKDDTLRMTDALYKSIDYEVIQ